MILFKYLDQDKKKFSRPETGPVKKMLRVHSPVIPGDFFILFFYFFNAFFLKYLNQFFLIAPYLALRLIIECGVAISAILYLKGKDYAVIHFSRINMYVFSVSFLTKYLPENQRNLQRNPQSYSFNFSLYV